MSHYQKQKGWRMSLVIPILTINLDGWTNLWRIQQTMTTCPFWWCPWVLSMNSLVDTEGMGTLMFILVDCRRVKHCGRKNDYRPLFQSQKGCNKQEPVLVYVESLGSWKSINEWFPKKILNIRRKLSFLDPFYQYISHVCRVTSPISNFDRKKGYLWSAPRWSIPLSEIFWCLFL